MRNVFRRIAGPLFSVPAAATALLVACTNDSGSGGNPVAPETRPLLEIRDGRSGGDPELYFLPPIQPTLASYPGTFDPGRQPVIEICAWNGTACVGGFVATFSRAGGTIVLDAANQLYRADWTTTSLVRGQLYRAVVREGAQQLGFFDAKIPGPNETAQGLIAQGIVPVGNGPRTAIRFKLQDLPAQNGAPSVTITAPADNTIVPSGTPLTLTGTATDPQQGDLSSQIVWRSSQVVGELGVGPSITATLAGGRHTISASVTDAGGLTDTETIQVVVSIVSVPATLNVPYGGTASLPITLSEPAPAGGLTFTVTSADPARVGVAPASTSVTIPAGQQSANATLQGVSPGVAAVTVANPDFGSATSQVTTTASLNIVQTSVAFPQGRTEPITIELESQGADIAAPPGGLVVALTSSNPGCVAAPSTVTIPAGLVSTTANLSFGNGTSTPCSATVTASVPSVATIGTDVVNVTVNQAPAISVNLGSGVRVGAGLTYGAFSVTLAAPAPAGGTVVTLTSATPSVLRLSSGPAEVGTASISLPIAQGNNSASFYIHGMEGQSGTVEVTASAPGYASATGSATVVPVAVDIILLDNTTTVLSPNDPFQVRVGAVNATNNGFYAEQAVRPGSSGLTFTVTHSNAPVAELVTSGGSADTRTVTVLAGESRSPASVATGGIEFDPTAGGTTNVSASAPGVVALPAATQTVTVSAPAITVNANNVRVGSGLRYGLFSVSLGAPAGAGGVPVTLTSSNGAVLRVSGNGASDVGAPSVTLTVPQGQSSVSFYLHGMEGQTGTADVTATAPGYTAGSATVSVVPVAYDIILLDNTTTLLSPNDEFQVRVGAVNQTNNAFYAEQDVRPGGTPLTFTVTNSNAPVAELVTSGGSADTRTVTVAVGQSRSPATVATGGIAFDPTGAGTTNVAASLPGGVALAGATQTVTVSAPAITVNANNVRVGSGLRYGLFSVSLGAPAGAGGVPVTITSANGAVLRVSSSNNSEVGAPSVTLTVPQGQSSVSFYLHGMEGQTGTVNVTATAPGYTDGSAAVSVVQPAVDIILLDNTTTTLSPNDEFQVRVGAINAANNGFYAEQDVRPGGTSPTFTVTHTVGGIADLVTSAGSADTRTVSIATGQSRSPATVATGGIAFDPLATGQTTVSASSAGYVSLPAASQTVTISAPAITVNANNVRVGSGLRYGLFSVSLGAPAGAGGVPVTLTSSNGAVLRVSGSGASDVGAPSVTLTVPQGQSSVSFYLHGMEGQTGTPTITATAPGYTNGTAAVSVVPVAVEILGLNTSISAGAANDEFQVRIGAVSSTGNGLYAEQDVRPGAVPLAVTVTNGTAAVADLVTSAGAADSRTVNVAVGQSRSPATVATGGIAFDPTAAGLTVVTASVPGGTAVPNSSQSVNVTP